MAEPIPNEARAEQNLAETNVDGNVKYELSEELLKELSSNTYSERVEEDVVDHISKVLEILDPIKVDVTAALIDVNAAQSKLVLLDNFNENYSKCLRLMGKQDRASCKSKTENSISLPLHLLHMDMFVPTFVKSLMKKMYCLVVTDDYSRFTWVFFLATKDETSGILKSFITGIENLVDYKVKVIRCDNGTEFKNREMNQFCEMKGILRQFSVARTPQQNGVVMTSNNVYFIASFILCY
ncbi:putative ribonuclease H-like domain-containing protein [Tanacetum coccineum]